MSPSQPQALALCFAHLADIAIVEACQGLGPSLAIARADLKPAPLPRRDGKGAYAPHTWLDELGGVVFASHGRDWRPQGAWFRAQVAAGQRGGLSDPRRG